MLLELNHERTLHWYMKPFKGHFELKVGPYSQQIFASLDISRIKLKGTGTVDGKRVELSFVDDDLHYIVPIRVEGHEGEWGTFRSRSSLMFEPAVFKVHDGREYFLEKVEWNVFRLYTGEGRTVMTMFMDRVDSLVTKMDMRFENVNAEERDYFLLTTLVFWGWSSSTGSRPERIKGHLQVTSNIGNIGNFNQDYNIVKLMPDQG